MFDYNDRCEAARLILEHAHREARQDNYEHVVALEISRSDLEALGPYGHMRINRIFHDVPIREKENSAAILSDGKRHRFFIAHKVDVFMQLAYIRRTACIGIGIWSGNHPCARLRWIVDVDRNFPIVRRHSYALKSSHIQNWINELLESAWKLGSEDNQREFDALAKQWSELR